LFEPGAFRTKAHTDNAVTFPEIPAYSNPELPCQAVRRQFKDPEKYFRGDVTKAAAKILEFSLIENPPLSWVILKENIDGVRVKLATVGKELDDYES